MTLFRFDAYLVVHIDRLIPMLPPSGCVCTVQLLSPSNISMPLLKLTVGRACTCLVVADREEECCVRTLSLVGAVSDWNARSVPRDIPPGAVGGLYGSGCFHFSSSFSVSTKRTWLAAVSRKLSCLLWE